MPEHGKITPKRLAWVTEYLTNGRNGRAAYKTVFNPNASDSVTDSYVTDIKADPKVKAIIAKADLIRDQQQRATLDRYGVTEQKIIDELAFVAMSRAGDYWTVGSDGLPRIDFSNLDEFQKAAICEVSYEIIGYTKPKGDGEPLPISKVKYKTYDKLAALEKLAKIKKMLTDKVEHKVEISVENLSDDELSKLAKRLTTEAQ